MEGMVASSVVGRTVKARAERGPACESSSAREAGDESARCVSISRALFLTALCDVAPELLPFVRASTASTKTSRAGRVRSGSRVRTCRSQEGQQAFVRAAGNIAGLVCSGLPRCGAFGEVPNHDPQIASAALPLFGRCWCQGRTRPLCCRRGPSVALFRIGRKWCRRVHQTMLPRIRSLGFSLLSLFSLCHVGCGLYSPGTHTARCLCSERFRAPGYCTAFMTITGEHSGSNRFFSHSTRETAILINAGEYAGRAESANICHKRFS